MPSCQVFTLKISLDLSQKERENLSFFSVSPSLTLTGSEWCRTHNVSTPKPAQAQQHQQQQRTRGSLMYVISVCLQVTLSSANGLLENSRDVGRLPALRLCQDYLSPYMLLTYNEPSKCKILLQLVFKITWSHPYIISNLALISCMVDYICEVAFQTFSEKCAIESSHLVLTLGYRSIALHKSNKDCHPIPLACSSVFMFSTCYHVNFCVLKWKLKCNKLLKLKFIRLWEFAHLGGRQETGGLSLP